MGSPSTDSMITEAVGRALQKSIDEKVAELVIEAQKKLQDSIKTLAVETLIDFQAYVNQADDTVQIMLKMKRK